MLYIKCLIWCLARSSSSSLYILVYIITDELSDLAKVNG